jgi:hypothetical protein
MRMTQSRLADDIHGMPTRPKVIDDDMPIFARALGDKGVPVPEIVKRLLPARGWPVARAPPRTTGLP